MPFFIVRILVFIPVMALSAAAKWFPTSGPPNAWVPILFAHDNALYAGTENPAGVFKSTDSGNTWQAASFSIRNSVVTSKRAQSITALGHYLFAGMSDSLLRSGDGGKTWEGVSPQTATFMASGNGVVYAGNSRNLFRSLDSGITWETIGPETGKYLQCLAASDSAVYVGADDSGTVFKSSDRGANWSRLAPAGKRALFSLALAPGVLFAGDKVGTVHLSRDGGSTWRESAIPGLTSLIDCEVAALAVAGESVYAATGSGLFGSSDTGKTWKALSDRNLYSWDLRFNTVLRHGAWVYAGGKGGAIRVPASGKAGLPTQINFGLGHGRITGLGVSGRRIYAGYAMKGLQSTAFGEYWESIQSYGNLTPTAYMPFEGGLLAASKGSSVGAGIRRYGIPASIASWEPADIGFSETSVYALARMGSRLFAASDKGVYRSEDSARSWQPVTAGLGSGPFQSLATRTSSLFAAAHDQGLFRSRDTGQSWRQIGGGVLKNPIVAISASRNAVLVLADSGRDCFHSGDEGETWTETQVGPSGLRLQAIASSDSVTLVGTTQGVYRSGDGGQTWSDFSDGMFSLSLADGNFDLSVTKIAIGDTLVAMGTERGSVWRRTPKELTLGSFRRTPARRSNVRRPYDDAQRGRMVYPNPKKSGDRKWDIDARGVSRRP